MSETSDDDNDYITERHIRQIGAIVVGWNLVERVIENTIAALLKPPHWILAEITTAHLTFPQKLNILSGLADVSFHDTPHKIEFAEVLSEINRLNGVRDMVSHGRWVKGSRPNAIKRWRVKARGSVKIEGFTPNEPEYTPEDLRSEFEAMEAALQRFYRLLQATGLDVVHAKMTNSFATLSNATELPE